MADYHRAPISPTAVLPQPSTATPTAAAAPASAKRTTPKGKKNKKKRTRLSGEGAGPKPYVPDVAIRSIDGHVIRTGATVTAWYRLAPQRWSFRADHDRTQLLNAVAGQYADLQGRWLHIRVTSRPVAVATWAEAHVRNAINRLPDTPNAQSFDQYIVGEQMQLQGRSMHHKEIYLGIEVQRRGLSDLLVDQARPILSRVWPTLLDAEVLALADEIAHLDNIVAAPGFQGRPVTMTEMRWLLHRSTHLGLPAPKTMPGCGDGTWSSEDLAAVTDGVEVFQDAAYAPTVTVRGRAVNGASLERHVAVLTIGQVEDLNIPAVDQPWMARADMMPVPVEWSARIYVRDPQDVKAELLRQTSKVQSQVNHFEVEHGLTPPQQLARQADLAEIIEDEMSSGNRPTTMRMFGWWRVAVSGRTRREATGRAQQLLDLYKPKIAIEHPEDQYHLYREFIPGEPLSSRAYQRRGSVMWAAAAMPTATSFVGDRRGILLGETTGASERPVAWDPWLTMERDNSSGLTALVAGLGGGKSFLGGGIVYKSLRAGAHWTILDPSGPLANLARIPELAPYSKVINLLDAEPGILNPYRVVPDPVFEDYLDEADPQKAYIRAQVQAGATRRRLCLDVLMGVLPYEVAHSGETQIVLNEAVRAAGSAVGCHPGRVIDRLLMHQGDFPNHAKVLNGILSDLMDQLALLIPETDADPYAQTRTDRLTVLTMPGLILPKDGVPRHEWSDSEALGIELLNLAAWLTQRQVYNGPPGHQHQTGTPWKTQRKGVWIDEAFFLSEVPSGRVLMNRFARDSRKWNVRVLLSSQIPKDFLKIPGFNTLVNSTFVGGLNDYDAQSDALGLLNVPANVGYEAVIGSLSATGNAAAGIAEEDPAARTSANEPRRFIFADGAGGIESIRVDFSGDHLEQLRQALNTTPGQFAPPALQARLHRQLPAAQRDGAAQLEWVEATVPARPQATGGHP